MIGFDLSQVTGDITQATLVLSLAEPATNWGNRGRMLDVHRLTELFTEGNGFLHGQPRILQDRRGHGIRR